MLSKSSILYQAKKYLGILVIRITEAMLSLFDNRDWCDKNDFAFTKILEANAGEIRREFIAVQAKHFIPNIEQLFPEQIQIAGNDNWKTFWLILYGYDMVQHLEECPVTKACLEKIPGMTSAMFSVLEPHKNIPPHRGIYKGVLRCHLGLIVEAPEKCKMVVNGEEQHWQEGECMFFDDTFMHMAVNDSTSKRVVLFIDFLRSYPFPFNYINYFVFNQIAKSEYIGEVLVNSNELDGVNYKPRKINYLHHLSATT
ncbi:MAG: aspartyl beta-hydroxylase [Bacteroidota bacterium]|nr:aspartyl beta-hydroxylase [Bacteroidota bacterium]